MSRRSIFIGDVQGCYDGLNRLLERLRFDPETDRLCMAGDLVNRGGKSLKVLRMMSRLDAPHLSVLGNHDLHLLAYAEMYPKVRKPNAEFEKILNHAEADRIIRWLRQQPVLWYWPKRRIALVHAGIDPRWTRDQAMDCAEALHKAIRGEKFGRYIQHMYGDRPAHWAAKQKKYVRLRTTTNVFTRMRYAKANGRIKHKASGGLRNRPKGYRPWFDLLHKDWHDWHIVFGHWSTLGLYQTPQVTCLDSGCVWGGALTALTVQGKVRTIVQHNC
ncbi:MAG: symmetrical bis(5'-nucleosyl)-tetraphosphatase [Pseudomonadota bacterium]